MVMYNEIWCPLLACGHTWKECCIHNKSKKKGGVDYSIKKNEWIYVAPFKGPVRSFSQRLGVVTVYPASTLHSARIKQQVN